jgi:hypothetical protein
MPIELKPRHSRALLIVEQYRACLRGCLSQQIVRVCAPKIERFSIHMR